MEEYRRFFRYILPGLIFFIELSAFVFLSHIEKLEYAIKNLIFENKIVETIGIGTSIVAFLATGGLGYIFGSFYHVLFHFIRRSNAPLFSVDHLPVIMQAHKNEWIVLKGPENEDIDAERISQSGAWRILAAFWNERLESSAIIKAAEARSKSLQDILHGTGTTVIASLTAILAWYAIRQHYGASPTRESLIAMAVLLFGIHVPNYLFVVRDYQGVINANVLHAMKDIKDSSGRPSIIFTSAIDYKLFVWKKLKSILRRGVAEDRGMPDT